MNLSLIGKKRKIIINFTYKYPFVSRGIISHFIVKMNEKIVKNKETLKDKVWRSGVYIEGRSCYAKITEENLPNNLEIKIEIRGFDISKCRRFLQDIRNEIDSTNRRFFKNISVEKLIPCNQKNCNGDGKFLFDFERLIVRLNNHNKIAECQKCNAIQEVTTLLENILFPNELTKKSLFANRQNINLFICSSEEDKEMLNELNIHLKSIQNKYKVSIFSNQNIPAGSSIKEKIKKQIILADVFLFLISPHFLASKSISWQLENIKIRYEKFNRKILPIKVRDCHDSQFPSWLNELQTIPKYDKFIKTNSYQDTAWKEVVREFVSIIN